MATKKKTGGRKRPAKRAAVPATTMRPQEFPSKVEEAMRGLSVLERKFVQIYCSRARGNGTLAAQIAGYGTTYSASAARSCALLRQPNIRAAIDAWMTAFAMNAAEVTWRITEMTSVNPGPFFEVNADGKLQLKEKLTQEEWDEYKHWVKEVETDPKTGAVTRVVLHDAMQALRELAKINKLYTDNVIVNFNMQVQQMSDEELVRQLAEARAEHDATQNRLPPGPPVAVVNPSGGGE